MSTWTPLKVSCILGILLLGFVLRLYHITGAIADWHSWRQADTAAVARNFNRFSFDPLRPRYDDLSNIQTGFDNPQGYRMVEFPLYQSIGFGFSKVIPVIPLEVWLRVVTILCSLGTLLLVGLMVAYYTDTTTGLVAMFWGAVLPYNIYYGRSILPDPMMVFFSIASLYALHIYNSKRVQGSSWVYLVFSAILASLALLVKPMAVFLLVPAGYLFLRNIKFTWTWVVSVLVFAAVTLSPILWWRQWIAQFPVGIPVYTWLFNEGNIRFKGAWFYWLFAERLGELILGYWGTVLFGLGVLLRPVRGEGAFFRWWLLGVLLYFSVIARGNVQHDYYQILIIPVVTVYLARGTVFLWRSRDIFGIWGKCGVVVLSLLLLSLSWYTVRTYYWINKGEIIEAGKYADAVLPKNAKVIAPYSGDTTFLYQTNRQGWPIGFEIDKKISMGATAYLTVASLDTDFEAQDLAKRYVVLKHTDKYTLIDLTKRQ